MVPTHPSTLESAGEQYTGLLVDFRRNQWSSGIFEIIRIFRDRGY